MNNVDRALLPMILTGMSAEVYAIGTYGWDAGLLLLCTLAYIFTCFCYFSMHLHIAIHEMGEMDKSTGPSVPTN